MFEVIDLNFQDQPAIIASYVLRGPRGVALIETGPASTRPVSSHALAPAAVLQVYASVQRWPPPPAFVLCIRGNDFRLGEGLSPAAERNLAAARARLVECLDDADAARWRQLIPAPAQKLNS